MAPVSPGVWLRVITWWLKCGALVAAECKGAKGCKGASQHVPQVWRDPCHQTEDMRHHQDRTSLRPTTHYLCSSCDSQSRSSCDSRGKYQCLKGFPLCLTSSQCPSFSSLLTTTATTNAAPPGRRATTATPCPGRWQTLGVYVHLSVPSAQTRALLSVFLVT